jgi:uncharacterized membrane protein YeiH
MLLDALDLGATFVFAISGATQGVRKRLDLFGVLVVAWAAGVAGGIARDLLIGAVPPAAIAHWRYFAITIAAGLVGFFAAAHIARLKTPVQLFDAAGLCLFAVTGTEKALVFGLNPFVAAGAGHGHLHRRRRGAGPADARDPNRAQGRALRRGSPRRRRLDRARLRARLPPVPVMVFEAGPCFSLRLMSLYRGWRLPSSQFPKETYELR